MLVRHIQKSGGKIYGNKRLFGRRELRNVFIGAAESAMRTETRLRDHYDALRENQIKEFKNNFDAKHLPCFKKSAAARRGLTTAQD